MSFDTDPMVEVTMSQFATKEDYWKARAEGANALLREVYWISNMSDLEDVRALQERIRDYLASDTGTQAATTVPNE